MGFEIELALLLGLHIIGTAVFGRFEAETSAWRKIFKWTILTGLTFAVYQFSGHWALFVPLFGVGSGLIFHFYWASKNQIHPINATPRRRYYELRGWQWSE